MDVTRILGPLSHWFCVNHCMQRSLQKNSIIVIEIPTGVGALTLVMRSG